MRSDGDEIILDLLGLALRGMQRRFSLLALVQGASAAHNAQVRFRDRIGHPIRFRGARIMLSF